MRTITRNIDPDFPEKFVAKQRAAEAEKDNQLLSDFIRELSKPDLVAEELVIKARRLA